MIGRLCLAAALLVPATASAQGNPGPFGTLFGRAAVRTGQDETSVQIRTSAGGNYDTALLAPEGQILDRQPQAGMGAGGVVGLVIAHTSGKLTANLTGGAAREHYFREPQDFGVNRYSANGGVDYKITSRFETDASVGYSLSPHYSYMQDFGPSQSVLIDPTLTPFSPYAVEMLENETIAGTVGLKGRVARHTALSASVNGQQVKFSEQPESNFQSSGFRANLTQEINRDLSAHVGYGRDLIKAPTRLEVAEGIEDGRDGTGYNNEVIDAGIDFNHSFSLARRTTLSFNTSTSIVRQTGFEGQFRINGGITFTKYFRRTWQVAAQANRTTQYLAGFVEPVFSDTAGASISGMFSTRVDWLASVAGGRGQYAFSTLAGFNTVTGTTRLGLAVNKYVQVFGQYVAFLSEVPPGATTIGLPGRTGRQAVMVGVGAFVPVYHKVRAGK